MLALARSWAPNAAARTVQLHTRLASAGRTGGTSPFPYPAGEVSGTVRCMAAGSPKEVHVTEQQDADGTAVRYVQTLKTGRHVLLGDLMPAAGGTDAGPSPKELALLSLGMCTSMTVRMFADASRFPLASVSVTVRENTAEGAHLPDGVVMEIALEGPGLTDAQRQRLLRAASKCPVKRMFAGEMPEGIKTQLAENNK